MTISALHPDAVASLAERAAHSDTAQDRRLDRIEEMVTAVHDGNTEFQKSHTRALKLLTFQVQALAMQKVLLPGALTLSAFFFGGSAAVMILEHFR